MANDTAPITTDDILDLVEYERRRVEIRSDAIAARKARRIHVGDKITFAFENLQTVRYQVQEMVRVERIVDESLIQHEIDTYSALVPGPSELSATMFIELDGDALLRHWLPLLVGIEHTVAIRVGDTPASTAIAEEGRSTDEITSTVHYLRFPVSDAQLTAMRAGAEVVIAVGHPELTVEATVEPATVELLISDLAELTP